MFPTTIGTLARDAEETGALAFQRRGLACRPTPQEGSSRRLLINKDSRPAQRRGRRDRTCPLYPLKQPHESCDDRYGQEQENGLQDAPYPVVTVPSTHGPVVIVHSISRRSPHFGTSYLRPVATKKGCQPASPARRGRLTRLLRLTAHEAGVPASGGRRGLRNRTFLSRLTAHDGSMGEPALGRWPPRTTYRVRPRPRQQCPTSGSQVRRKSASLLRARMRARLLMTFSCFHSFESRCLSVRNDGRETALRFGGTATCTAPMRRWLKRSG